MVRSWYKMGAGDGSAEAKPNISRRPEVIQYNGEESSQYSHMHVIAWNLSIDRGWMSQIQSNKS